MVWNKGIRGAVLVCLAVLVVGRSAAALEPEFEVDAVAPESSPSKRLRMDKVKVELYYMPQCPGCRQLISTSFREAFSTPGFLDMADVTFVPYGHDKGQDPQQRVLDNAMESCALHTIGRSHQAQQFDYIDCINHSQNKDASRVDRDCANLVGLSQTQIRDMEACAVSHQGQVLAEYNIGRSKSVVAKYFPWIVVNRQHTAFIEDSVWNSLFDHVCEVYSGPHKSIECPESEQDDDTVEEDDDGDDDVNDDEEEEDFAEQL